MNMLASVVTVPAAHVTLSFAIAGAIITASSESLALGLPVREKSSLPTFDTGR